MKKITFLGSVFALGTAFSGFAQHITNDEVDLHNRCGEHVYLESFKEHNPDKVDFIEKEEIAFQRQYEKVMSQNFQARNQEKLTIPVVVHVVHLFQWDNIGEQQIYDAIAEANEDLSASNNELGSVVDEFKGVIGDANIRLEIASKDVNGNCHPGITRTLAPFDEYLNLLQSGATPEELGEAVISWVQSSHGSWPQKNYMNVYVLQVIPGASGFAPFPFLATNADEMEGGVFMRTEFFGNSGQADWQNFHIFSHEIGHWLNLRHTWGAGGPKFPSACFYDDGVVDTPNCTGEPVLDGDFFSCSPEELKYVSCGTLDNVQNFMDYGSCPSMFTEGQAVRMRTALQNPLAGRNNLWTPENLLLTGVGNEDEPIEKYDGSPFSNIALNGTASQSSTYNAGNANRAIDGNRSGFYGSQSVTHTNEEFSPKWQVEFADVSVVSAIRIFNRTDACCKNRLSNFTVRVLNGCDVTFSQTIAGTAEEQMTLIPDGVLGNRVEVQINGAGILSLAEVEVYGTTFDENTTPSDPSIVLAESDAFTKSGRNSGKNFGDLQHLTINNNPEGSIGSDKETYLRFDLSEVPNNVSFFAALSFHIQNIEPDAVLAKYKVEVVGNNWIESGEGGINWQNAPSAVSGSSELIRDFSEHINDGSDLTENGRVIFLVEDMIQTAKENPEIYGDKITFKISLLDGAENSALRATATENPEWFNHPIINFFYVPDDHDSESVNGNDLALAEGLKAFGLEATADVIEDRIAATPVKVFPNPATETINISLPTDGESVEVDVIGLNGAVVLSQIYQTNNGMNTLQMNIGSLSSGSYILKVQHGEKTSFEKVLINRN